MYNGAGIFNSFAGKYVGNVCFVKGIPGFYVVVGKIIFIDSQNGAYVSPAGLHAIGPMPLCFQELPCFPNVSTVVFLK